MPMTKLEEMKKEFFEEFVDGDGDLYVQYNDSNKDITAVSIFEWFEQKAKEIEAEAKKETWEEATESIT